MKHLLRTPRMSCTRPAGDIRRQLPREPPATCAEASMDSQTSTPSTVMNPRHSKTSESSTPLSLSTSHPSAELRSSRPSSVSRPGTPTRMAPTVAWEEAVRTFKKKSLNFLPYFDLTNLPLIAVLSRKASSLVLLVNAANIPGLGGPKPCLVVEESSGDVAPQPVIVKLFASKTGTVDQHRVLEQFRSFTSGADLDRSVHIFHRELILLDRCQRAWLEDGSRDSGVVKLLGWGTAENYHGVILEAIRGPSLVDILLKTDHLSTQFDPHWSGSPPAPLQLLFRFQWALQLARVMRIVHARQIIHKDVRAENFAFRFLPSARSFGQIALFDFDGATLWRPHDSACQELLTEQPESPRGRESGQTPRQLAFSSHPDYYWLNDAFGNYEADLGVGCLHWPLTPPQISTVNTATVDAPEVAYCSCNASCPSGCKAEWIRYRSQQITWDGGSSQSAQSSSGRPRCLCPLCECHRARCDIWSLGVLLSQVMDLREGGAEAVVRTCRTCHERLAPQSVSMQSWVGHVTSVFDRLLFENFGFAPVPETVASALDRSFVAQPVAQSAHNLHETAAMHSQKAHRRIPTGPSSNDSRARVLAGHARMHSLMWLLERRTAWQQLAQTVEDDYTALVLNMTSIDARDRPAIEEVESALEKTFTQLYVFLAGSQIFRLPLWSPTE